VLSRFTYLGQGAKKFPREVSFLYSCTQVLLATAASASLGPDKPTTRSSLGHTSGSTAARCAKIMGASPEDMCAGTAMCVDATMQIPRTPSKGQSTSPPAPRLLRRSNSGGTASNVGRGEPQHGVL
jgi:hypothetical protein